MVANKGYNIITNIDEMIQFVWNDQIITNIENMSVGEKNLNLTQQPFPKTS